MATDLLAEKMENLREGRGTLGDRIWWRMQQVRVQAYCKRLLALRGDRVLRVALWKTLQAKQAHLLDSR